MKTLKENAFHCNYLQLAVFKHLGLKPFGRCHIIGEQSLLQYLQYLAERSFTWWHAALFGRELRWGSSGSMWGCHERQGLQFCTDCAIRVLYIKRKCELHIVVQAGIQSCMCKICLHHIYTASTIFTPFFFWGGVILKNY